ncbi:flavodoxin [Anaerobacillus sp. MEB173]|uniref:flavodoxin n=1 Tax=Anaerobacillus sp. MEB173 TaxID=3383345 RepID=UPI003F9269DF
MMSTVLMVYASMTGNTEQMADLIEEGLKSEGIELDRYEVSDIDADRLNEYDSFILGAYTWGEGELPDEFLDFYDDMAGIDLSDKHCAVFGSGSTSYEVYCGAVDLLESMIEEKGGTLIVPGLKVEMFPEDEDEDRCKSFGTEFGKKIKG